MSDTIKILAFAGSAREASFNKKFVKVAAEYAKKAGAQVTLIDLRDFPMPLMDQDLETKSGIPEHAQRVKDLMATHDAFLISAPEYNSSITPLLKNTLDWASRPSSKTEASMVAYKGKVAALLSASPGALGGLRGLPVVRAVLQNNGTLVLSQQQALSKAHEAFDATGNLVDAKQQEGVQKLVDELIRVTKKLKI
jgi:chromate reductase